MYGGIISKESTKVPGTYRQHSYHDSWEESYPITYDGELTPEVCEAIKTAWQNWQNSIPRESSWGQLRWRSPSSFIRVDVETRAVIAFGSCNLCD